MLGLVIDKQERAYDILWSFYPLLHIFLEKKIKNKKESKDVLSQKREPSTPFTNLNAERT